MKMTKKVILLLFILSLGTISMNAQVTIGADDAPHPGAVLDLRSPKGLKLPTVALLNVDEFQLSSASDAVSAVGMMVYNTNANTTGGQGPGIYIWDGTKWLFAAISGTAPVTVIGAGTVTGSVDTYKTWCFIGTPGNICWMTENSKEGTSSATAYPDHSVGERGYYYTWTQAAAACPSGWTLPAQAEWDALMSYLNGSPDATFKTAWYSSALAGSYANTNTWVGWDSHGRWWSSTSSGQFYDVGSSMLLNGPRTIDAYYMSVRCVKSN
jgi:uncharacterized protein (TIGR02145 family)